MSDTPTTGTAGEPAQPDNLPHVEMQLMLQSSMTLLERVQGILKGTRTRAKADQVRRELAGVVGKLETIRLALKM